VQDSIAPAPAGFGARWECAAPQAEVGAGLALELVIDYPNGRALSVDFSPLEQDGSFVILSQRPLRYETTAAGLRARARLELASLEAGRRELPAPRVSLGTDLLAPAPLGLEFRPVLAEGEDAPRPLRPLLSDPPPPVSRRNQYLALAAVALLAVAAAVWWRTWRARSRARAAAPVEPSALERLEALLAQEPRALDGRERAREAHELIVRALRERISTGSAAGSAAVGLTDREWAARIGSGLARESASELEALVSAAEAVKYGPEQPTGWATHERAARARALVRAAAAPTQGGVA
jgi:hypothetical protein